MTTSRIRTPYYFFAAVVTWSTLIAPAHAQLGSMRTMDAAASSGQVTQFAKNGQPLSFDETTDQNGITVRQYVDASGTVYAVSWHGAAMVDLQTLLGTYFTPYRSAAAGSLMNHGLHASVVSKDDLIVETSVRLRQFVGRAWLTSGLPAGVTPADIE